MVQQAETTKQAELEEIKRKVSRTFFSFLFSFYFYKVLLVISFSQQITRFYSRCLNQQLCHSFFLLRFVLIILSYIPSLQIKYFHLKTSMNLTRELSDWSHYQALFYSLKVDQSVHSAEADACLQVERYSLRGCYEVPRISMSGRLLL